MPSASTGFTGSWACSCAKVPKRRVKAKLRDDRRPAVQANETWAMDFVHDQLATGRKIRELTIVDTFTRFSPAIEPRFSFKAEEVVAVLERVGREHGLPQTIRVDQGTEFVSRDLDLWAYQRGVTLDFSRPGKPTDNSFIESLNGCQGGVPECPLVHGPRRRAVEMRRLGVRITTRFDPIARSATSLRSRS